jgi:hypothetical protein
MMQTTKDRFQIPYEFSSLINWVFAVKILPDVEPNFWRLCIIREIPHGMDEIVPPPRDLAEVRYCGDNARHQIGVIDERYLEGRYCDVALSPIAAERKENSFCEENVVAYGAAEHHKNDRLTSIPTDRHAADPSG